MLISTSSSDQPSDQSPDYKTARLEEQIKWHSKKARHNKSRFKFYEIIVIFAGAIIPIVNIIEVDPGTRIVSSILGGLIAIVTGITQLEKYQENRILYRCIIFYNNFHRTL
jgi:predicted membrane channel-forming protein YqfA (hemolysin III family)